MSRTGCRRFSPSPTATRCCAAGTSSKPAGWPTSTGATSCARSSGANCTPARTSQRAAARRRCSLSRAWAAPASLTTSVCRSRPAKCSAFTGLWVRVAASFCTASTASPRPTAVRFGSRAGSCLPAGRPTAYAAAWGWGPRTGAGVVRRGRERALVARMVERLRIKLATPRMAVSGLSGGNQQKVVLARCLATDPLCLLCDEPTRGIDEGAKREVYALIGQFTAQGGAAIVVSSEAPELLTLSDRIAIFNKGRLAQVVAVADATQEQLLHLAS